MRTLVVDTNRIISALLRDGETRRAILGTTARLYAPQSLQEEVMNHLADVAKRVGVGPDALATVLTPMLKRIQWVRPDNYGAELARAAKALGRTNPKDVPFLACALFVRADAIWSMDKGFDKQSLVPRVPHPEAPIPTR